MKQKKHSLLKKAQWGIECGAFLAVERLLSLVPIETLWKTGARLSGVARLFASRWPTVRKNLQTVLGPNATRQEVRVLTRKVFRHTAANLLCSLKGAHMSMEEIRSAITIENEDAGWRALAQGKGIILITPHMGNWELLAQAMAAFQPDLKVATIFRPLNNIYLDKIIRDRRSKRGMRMFAKLTSYHGPVRFLEHNSALALLVDQRAGRVGTLTPFFGRLMSMSPLPEFVHRRTGAPALGISMRTTAPGRWTIRFHEPTLEEGESFGTPHMAALLEEVIRDSIADEFWMQNLWRVNQRRPLETRAKRGPVRLERDRDKPLYPYSVLVRVSDQPDRFGETIPALTSLAASRPDIEIHLLASEQLRSRAAQSGVPHTFHPIESNALPETVCDRLQLGIALTDHEPVARELVRFHSGPTYSLPEVSQAQPHWHVVSPKQEATGHERWSNLLLALGMHDPPLEWEYL